MTSLSLDDRALLEARWLDLTRRTLPRSAAARDWPVSADHCFQRILLDNAVGGCWYDHIAGRPAYAKAPDTVLTEAVRLADLVLAGADLHALNARSLAWRRAARRRTAAASINRDA
ncbi:GCN5-related N-acetyltransferase [Sphingomonas arantia]|uniref:GCN5-related N-acetyltransferase n=1 Tax=Sphingomonas arantia TaxID=1460676 RepID=A0ABW4TXA3_9SPHN